MNVYSAMLNLPGNINSDVLRCTNCGAHFLWPYVSDEVISELYQKSYFTGVSENLGCCPIPGSGMDYESIYAFARIDKYRTILKRLLTYHSKARSILDIGAATGEFLSIAKEEGLEVTGIELSSHASSRAKEKYGFDFHRVRIEDYRENEQYDLIHINHVFEHLTCPNVALERINSLLGPNGIIYVEVPFQFNVFEVLKYVVTGKRKPFDVFSIHHPVFYRPRTLKRIFEAHGFVCKEMCVFDWSRYPASSLAGSVKRLLWFAGSLVRQGIMIEAFFNRGS